MLIKFIGPPPKPTELTTQVIQESDIDALEHNINMDFEENSPYLGVISETYQRPNKSYFQEPPEFQGLVSIGKLGQKFQPKQAVTSNHTSEGDSTISNS